MLLAMTLLSSISFISNARVLQVAVCLSENIALDFKVGAVAERTKALL